MPGGLLVRWPALVAVVVLIVNDHVLKPQLATWWTGKLSGVAAMVLVPFFVLAVLEVLRGRALDSRSRLLVVGAIGLVTAFVMTGVELLPSWSAAYEVVFGALRWPLDVAVALGGGRDIPAVGRAVQTMDATDLATVPAALLPWAWLRWREDQSS